MKKQKNRGITLVALIITIIVMLILVAVTVAVVVDSDIIGQAEQAGELYKNAYATETVDNATINGGKHNTIEGYIGDLSTDADVSTDVYAVGDIVKLKNTKGEGSEDDIEEEFYVIKDEGDTVVLLSKYNIKEEDGNWIQDKTGAINPMPFSSTPYWGTDPGNRFIRFEYICSRRFDTNRRYRCNTSSKTICK